MSLAESLELWKQEFKANGLKEGREQGLQEGRQEGEGLALQRLLAKRFGALPTESLAKISAASTGDIELWLDRLLEANSLDEIFR